MLSPTTAICWSESNSASLHQTQGASIWRSPFTFVTAVVLTIKAREGGRVINAVALVATGINADGRREVLGLRVATSEIVAAWNSFFADLVAGGLFGVHLVASDAHQDLAATSFQEYFS